MPAGGRYPPQLLGGPFSHNQHSQLPHHFGQHNQPIPNSLPPPSLAQYGSGHSIQSNGLGNYGAMSGVNGLGTAFTGGPGLGAGGTGLASQAAQAGFALGAHREAQQQQMAREDLRRNGVVNKGQKGSRIREVWAHNLAQEMQALRELVDKYPYISMVSHACPSFCL